MFSSLIAIITHFLFITFVWSLDKPIILQCSTNLNDFQKNHGTTVQEFIVQCDCQRFKTKNCYVVGTDIYTPSSSICCSGLHSGKISLANNQTTMLLQIFHEKKSKFAGSFKNGIKSRNFSPHMQKYFKLSALRDVEITTTATFSSTSVNIHKAQPKNLTTSILKFQSTGNVTVKLRKFYDVKSTTNSSIIGFPMIAGICGAAVLIVVIAALIYRCRRLNHRWFIRIPRRFESDSCVGYATTDSENLIYEPDKDIEMCESNCPVEMGEVKEDLHDKCKSDVNCNECTVKYNY